MTFSGIRKLLAGRRPFGLFSFRYFWFGQSAELAMHRRMFFCEPKGRSRLLWAFLQMWLAAKWRMFHARGSARRYVDFHGPRVEAREGISIARQHKVISRLSRKFCIDPHDAYLFQLYRNPQDALAYVYACENASFHRVMNKAAAQDEFDLLQDKYEFACQMGAQGLPVAKTVRLVRNGESFDRAAIENAPDRQVFCKSRSGFRSLGAFSAWIRDDRLAGETIRGVPLASEQDVAGAWRALCQDQEFLVQPLLKNHSVFAPVSLASQPVALRLVTRQNPHGGKVLNGFLKMPIPASTGKSGEKTYLMLNFPIDVETGIFRRPERSLHTLNPSALAVEAEVFSRLESNTQLPFWSEVIQASLQAQQSFSSLWTLGWDWVLTPDGPRLLEGNINWNIEKPQVLDNKGLIGLALK